ncbi:hypothetical protein L1987_42557 [Smallanthus sonchifolius]|uniref:Uncharacterized protein n=1 Tax=Smallanthus sonchifolius TaxID=185202 RepID=A0ACB9GIP2_9ASTR|nr:hypothetical protein L1987_42557 [Smallanthus sonchifolius]
MKGWVGEKAGDEGAGQEHRKGRRSPSHVQTDIDIEDENEEDAECEDQSFVATRTLNQPPLRRTSSYFGFHRSKGGGKQRVIVADHHHEHLKLFQIPGNYSRINNLELAAYMIDCD